MFTEEVGLTPKRYSRIQHFQQVLRRIHRRQRVAWAPLAQACGYYDQAHLIHEFRAFSGLSRTAYLRFQGEHLNQVPFAD